MAKILCLLALCFTAVLGSPIQPRIINGSTVSISRYPFVAAFLFAHDSVNFFQLCGGIIITNRSVLTAAHCMNNRTARQVRARVGSTYCNSGGVVAISSSLIRHPQYSSVTKNHDIGIMRLSAALVIGGNIQVGGIAGPTYNPADNQPVWAVGWGFIHPNGPHSEHLRHVKIRIVNQGTCARHFGNTLSPTMLCAGGGGSGVCFGDSGSPLFHNNRAVGIVALTVTPCARYPAAFMRISSYASWIQANR